MSRAPAPIAMRRRSPIERRVVGMLRGEDVRLPAQGDEAALETARRGARHDMLFFADLRQVAALHGLVVYARGTPYLSEDERTLLAWLAEAQRVSRSNLTIPRDVSLVAAVMRCAGLLEGLGIHLSYVTRYPAPARIKAARTAQTTERGEFGL